MRRHFDRRLLWGLVLALGLAARCRQYFLNASYWYDEAFVILVIRKVSYAELLGALPFQVTAPPFLLWIVRALFLLGGAGEMLMRLPAFLAGLAALFLMIPLARRALGMPHAFWPFAFLALGLHAVTHGSDVRAYTIDLLAAEIILLGALVLSEDAAGRRACAWAWSGLFLSAAFAPWFSFPAVLMLGSASSILAVHAWQRPERKRWLAWCALQTVALVSIGLLWRLVARHRYYPGLIEHWQKGWDGFPDWRSGLDIARWLTKRLYEIGNYANRDVGIILSLLAIVGAIFLCRKKPRLAGLLLVPFVLALGAALLGKYPLAHRTSLFLDPCLYLLAGAGVAGLASWRVLQGRLALLGVVVVLWSAGWMVRRTVRPDAGLDYRGAYQFIQSQRAPGDVIWSQMAVVYQTYYGPDAPVLQDHEFARAEQLVSVTRLWTVAGANRPDFQAKLEAAGGRVVLQHQVSGLGVRLFAPAKSNE